MKQLVSSIAPAANTPSSETPVAVLELRWLAVNEKHHVLAIRSKAGHVHLLRERSNWTVRHISPKSSHDLVCTPDYARAKAAAEVYVLASKPDLRLIATSASWRELPATENQRSRLGLLGVTLTAEGEAMLTAGMSSDLFQLVTALRAFAAASRS